MTADWILSHAAALLPVLFFLGGLRLMDSFKLVPRLRILACIAAGVAAAAICFFVNSWGFSAFPGTGYARFAAPFVEQLAKGLFWVILIATARVAFMVDAGICAFAVGAGFALAENLFYLHGLAVTGLGISIVRGLGTAVMHGGVEAIGAMSAILIRERWGWIGVRQFIPGLVAGTAIHSLFNQGLLSPMGSAIAMLVTMPALLAGLFLWSEASMRRWLGEKLDRDIELMEVIATGNFGKSRPGLYLQSLQDKFPPEVRGDMLCMLQMTIELSVRSKGDLLLREAGVEVPPDPEIDAQFAELTYLEKSIGRTGMMAIAPLLSQTPRELWEIRRLGKS